MKPTYNERSNHRHKGGVGKTSTCVILGIALEKHIKEVLLHNADTQGGLTISLGLSRPDKLPFTVSMHSQ